MDAEQSRQRVHLQIDGTVQGVGFRPYVYHLARSLGLAGFVRNDAHGVVVEIEGSPALIAQFINRLPVEIPPLATCEHIDRRDMAAAGEDGFAIVESQGAVLPDALVTPDAATCAACLAELFDPADRRYRYPFINCTNCGPRFTIVRGVPYDRPVTTMGGFTMCAPCRAEYEDPSNRRFHAQPNACGDCGPQARFVSADGSAMTIGDACDAVQAAARALREGAIVAVKGVGGYHLACMASSQDAVARLRQRKHRAEKPFAVMAPDIASAAQLVELDTMETALLISHERPIVLARRRPDADVADDLAPRQRYLGVMLAYSPLHHLLLADTAAPLVMTSGNVSDEPIAFRDEDALARLGIIADVFLMHDRPIQTRTDDSVVRVVTIGGERRLLTLRRSRGYVPVPLSLPVAAPRPMLACGGQLKNTFCLVRERRAWVGPHIGDLENYETLRSYTAGIEHMEQLFAVAPVLIAHDLHPEYLSTKYARERTECADAPVAALEGVQHHHAHLAACMAEHGERGPAVGAIFDGTGYGTDGAIWGGEILVGDLTGFERAAHLWAVRMPGGEAAVREPWRMACSWLTELSQYPPELPRAIAAHVTLAEWRAAIRLARTGLASPRTTSMGRLLDATAALCGVRQRISYEGQSAIELEMAADPNEPGRYPLPLIEVDAAGPMVLDGRVLMRHIVADLAACVPVDKIAARVHNGIAYAAATVCATIAKQRDIRTVVLSGGVFQNVLLIERTADLLMQEGLRVLTPRDLPMNDGGLSFGQAAVAASRMSLDRERTSGSVF